MFPDKMQQAKPVTMILEDTENNIIKKTERLVEQQGFQTANLVINTSKFGPTGQNASFISKNGSTAYTFTETKENM